MTVVHFATQSTVLEPPVEITIVIQKYFFVLHLLSRRELKKTVLKDLIN